MVYLQIQPVDHFGNQALIFTHKIIGKVIFRIHDEKVRHRAKPPLKTAVNIDVISLGIVLNKGGPEHAI